MNWESIRGNLLNSTLAALLSGLLTYSYATSQTAELTAQVKDLNKRFDRWETTARGRREFMNDAGARVELLCNENHDCRARFAPMHVPE